MYELNDVAPASVSRTGARTLTCARRFTSHCFARAGVEEEIIDVESADVDAVKSEVEDARGGRARRDARANALDDDRSCERDRGRDAGLDGVEKRLNALCDIAPGRENEWREARCGDAARAIAEEWTRTRTTTSTDGRFGVR